MVKNQKEWLKFFNRKELYIFYKKVQCYLRISSQQKILKSIFLSKLQQQQSENNLLKTQVNFSLSKSLQQSHNYQNLSNDNLIIKDGLIVYLKFIKKSIFKQGRQYLRIKIYLLSNYYYQYIILTMITRFKILPETLFRIQSRSRIYIRQKEQQIKIGKKQFDFIKSKQGLYVPLVGDEFVAPNGISFRPNCESLKQISAKFLKSSEQKKKDMVVYILDKGFQLPQSYVLIKTRQNHYSFQTSIPIKQEQFVINARQFFANQKKVTLQQLAELIK